MLLEITDVRVRRVFDTGPLKAILSVTLDGVLAIHDVKLVQAGGRFFAVMPSKKMRDGSFRDVVHPVENGLRAALEKAAIEAFGKEVAKQAAYLQR